MTRASSSAQTVCAHRLPDARPALAATRDWQIDAAKALAIVLVVLGHASGMPPAYKLFAYSFHVPLFFVLSGWVGERFGRRVLTGATVAKLARTLLIPYLSFFLVAHALWLLTAALDGHAGHAQARPLWDPLTGVLWANGAGLYVLPALWFLPALFVTTLAYIALRARLSAAAVAALSLALALAWAGWFPSLQVRLPLALDVLPVALFFVAVGGWLSRFADALRILGAGVGAIGCGVVVAGRVEWAGGREQPAVRAVGCRVPARQPAGDSDDVVRGVLHPALALGAMDRHQHLVDPVYAYVGVLGVLGDHQPGGVYRRDRTQRDQYACLGVGAERVRDHCKHADARGAGAAGAVDVGVETQMTSFQNHQPSQQLRARRWHRRLA